MLLSIFESNWMLAFSQIALPRKEKKAHGRERARTKSNPANAMLICKLHIHTQTHIPLPLLSSSRRSDDVYRSLDSSLLLWSVASFFSRSCHFWFCCCCYFIPRCWCSSTQFFNTFFPLSFSKQTFLQNSIPRRVCVCMEKERRLMSIG